MNIPLYRFFSCLSNEVRLRCLYLISQTEEVCVCDIGETLRITQPAASKALHCLKEAGLVAGRRDANWNYYRINPDMPAWMKTIFDTTVQQLEDSGQYLEDRKRIRSLAVSGCCR